VRGTQLRVPEDRAPAYLNMCDVHDVVWPSRVEAGHNRGRGRKGGGVFEGIDPAHERNDLEPVGTRSQVSWIY
jgi:hypothetical protein